MLTTVNSNNQAILEPHISHEKLSITDEQPIQNVQGTKFDLTKDISATIASAYFSSEPEGESSAVKVHTSDTADTKSGSTLVSNETSSLLQAQLSTSVANCAQIPEAVTSIPKETAGDQCVVTENVPASENCHPKIENPTKILQIDQASPSQTERLPSSEPREARLILNTPTMSAKKKSDSAVAQNDRLKQLQNLQLRSITRKSAARNTKQAKNSSVSIRDLDLARTPVNTEEPETSFRLWAQDSSLYGAGCDVDLETLPPMQKDLSIIPQVSSTHASHAQAGAPALPHSTNNRRSRWAVKDEMKAEKIEAGSNDWGSAIPSDATRASNVSDESFGKLLRNQEPAAHEPLCDWQGEMIPPPADWAERPRYNNNNPEFKAQFKSYIQETQRLQERFSSGVPMKCVPESLLQDEDKMKRLHPDGISMVDRSMTIGIENAHLYGYADQPEDTVKYAQPLNDSEYEAECGLDSDDEGNASFDRAETTESLVTNWNMHLANARGEALRVGLVPNNKTLTVSGKNEFSNTEEVPVEKTSFTNADDDEEELEAGPLTVPKLNIYLRPATRADLSELTRIYNWYIHNSSQPAELTAIDESAMLSRMEFCATSKLPFIVAAKKSQKNTRPIPLMDDEELSRRLLLPKTHKQHIALTRIKNLAGFCCANDFTQPDFVEHIAADIELYVDAEHHRLGVGRCLMDKMLQICDHSHQLSMDVPFHCDQEYRHLYGPGGNRNLHKICILLRKWHTPKPVTINVQGKRKSRKLAFAKTAENDYGQWMKEWFESFGFEEEGYLKKMGAKKGR